MGLFSNENQKKNARAFAAQQTFLGAQAQESVKAQEARVRSAEDARGILQGMLGAPGTYDLPGTAGGGGPSTTPGTAGSIFQTGTEAAGFDPVAKSTITNWGNLGQRRKQALENYERSGVLDPEAYAAQQSQSSEFRIRSRLTGEAEQLLAQEGPAWDMLENSTIGAITEGSGVQLRETMRDIKSRAAKGGTARRTALNEANEILARERMARTRINETWQANLQLYDFTRQNAERVMQGNQRWLDNLPQLRQTYQNTMGSLAEMMATVAIPVSQKASAAGYEAKSAVPHDYTGKMIMGLGLTLVSMAGGGGGGGGGMFSSMSQSFMNSAVSTASSGQYGSLGDVGTAIGSKAGAAVGGLFSSNPQAAGGEGGTP